MIRLANRLVALCAIALAVLMIGKPASASTVVVNFSGTLTGIASGSNPLGGSIGQAVSGTLSFGPVMGPFPITTPTTEVNSYWSADTSWTFSLGGASGGGLTTVTLFKEANPPTANFGADFFVDGTITGHHDRVLDFSIIANGADPALAPLTLATIPPTLSDWAARFAVAIISSGTLAYGGTTYSFDLTEANVATTPLPAALPLFLSAMLGLGVIARQRGRRVAARAA